MFAAVGVVGLVVGGYASSQLSAINRVLLEIEWKLDDIRKRATRL
jgi:hypothetical protein